MSSQSPCLLPTDELAALLRRAGPTGTSRLQEPTAILSRSGDGRTAFPRLPDRPALSGTRPRQVTTHSQLLSGALFHEGPGGHRMGCHKCHGQGDWVASLTQKNSYCLDFKLISTFAPIPPGDHLLILQVRKLRLGGIKGIVEPSLEPDSKPLHTGASEALGEGRMPGTQHTGTPRGGWETWRFQQGGELGRLSLGGSRRLGW